MSRGEEKIKKKKKKLQSQQNSYSLKVMWCTSQSIWAMQVNSFRCCLEHFWQIEVKESTQMECLTSEFINPTS